MENKREFYLNEIARLIRDIEDIEILQYIYIIISDISIENP